MRWELSIDLGTGLDRLDAWKRIQGLEASEHALDGMTQLALEGGVQHLHDLKLPNSLEVLTFGENFDQSTSSLDMTRVNFRGLEKAHFPSDLLSLTFQPFFNRSLEQVKFPQSLRSLTFGWLFNQSLEGVQLPQGLQSLTFGGFFNQSLEKVELPRKLLHLTFGEAKAANQSIFGLPRRPLIRVWTPYSSRPACRASTSEGAFHKGTCCLRKELQSESRLGSLAAVAQPGLWLPL